MFIISVMSLISLLIAGFHFLLAGELLPGASLAGTGIAVNSGFLFFLKKFFGPESRVREEINKDDANNCSIELWQQCFCR